MGSWDASGIARTVLFCYTVCVHGVFTEGLYLICEAVCSYRLHQVDGEGFVEQYPIGCVHKSAVGEKVVFYWFCEQCMESKKPFCSYS